jgi:hypothetical protein
LNKRVEQTPVEPKAINQTPKLITTHRFEIRAKTTRVISPTSLPNVQVAARGAGKRIKYGLVDMPSCFIEYHKESVALILKRDHEIINADPAKIEELRRILLNACTARHVELTQETIKPGLWSHTVMEDDGLNEFFKPLAVAQWGDQDLHFFEDNSHTGKVEMGGKRSYDAAENLRFMLLEFPKSFHNYNENIVKHLAVLDKIGVGLEEQRGVQADQRGAIQELVKAVQELRDAVKKKESGV